MEALVAHPEVMSDFVKDGFADLLAESTGGEAHPEMRLSENCDLVRHCTEVMLTAVREHHALVEPEKVAVMSPLGRSRPLFDHDPQVVDLIDHPLGKLGEDVVDDLFEFGQFHRGMLRQDP